MSELKFDAMKTPGRSHKLTVSPSGKRVTAKIAAAAAPDEEGRVIAFFKRVAGRVESDVTMRGYMQIGGNQITLWNDAKTHFVQFDNE